MISDKNIQSLAILGAGSWGTALGIHFARKNIRTCLWMINAEQAEEMQKTHCNSRYLPGITWPEALSCTSNLKDALTDADAVMIAVPSHAFVETLEKLKALSIPSLPLIWVTKGIEPHNQQLLHEVIAEQLGKDYPCAVASGPNFAREIALGLPAAITVASHNQALREKVSQLFKADNLRIYGSEDIIGVEVGGAVKNVIAIAVGICDGLQLGANARAALITRGLAEITRLGTAMGGKAETFTGMAGLGDLILTCTDNQSRNRRFGLLLGQHHTLEQAFKEIGQVVEGFHNVKQTLQLAQRYQVDMPITQKVYEVCYENLDPKQGAVALMQR